MTTLQTTSESTMEMKNPEDQIDRTLFDNYGPVNVGETIGRFFLGVLANLLFLPYSDPRTVTKV